jgi:hypothetical protein
MSVSYPGRFGVIVAGPGDYPGYSRFVRFRSDFRRETASDFFGISTIQVQWSLFPDFSAGIGLAKSLILLVPKGGQTPMLLAERGILSSPQSPQPFRPIAIIALSINDLGPFPIFAVFAVYPNSIPSSFG